MKITPNTGLSTLLSSKNPTLPKKSPDLPKKPLKPTARRKTARTPRLSKKAGPPTPLLRWKFDELNNTGNAAVDKSPEESPEVHRRQRRDKGVSPFSSRKLAAALWRLQVAESGGGGGAGEEEERRRRRRRESGDRLGCKPEVGQGGDQLSCHHASRECGFEAKDPLRSPCSVNGPTNGYLCERQSPFKFSNYAMEGATKWDPVYSKVSNENPNDSEGNDQKVNAASMISALEAEVEQARARIEELESERRCSKKKLEHFLKKLSEERAAWCSREHEKVRAIIDDVKADLTRERKNRQRLEIVNSKLVNELTESKLSAKRYMQDYEKERKARELIEEVCDELAREIGVDKAEVDSLKKECMRICEEVEDERRMLQMAEVWREERVQMKLIDAKVALDQKYSQMKQLIVELEKFLRLKGANLDVNEIREAQILQQEAASMDITDIKEFTYEPSKSDDIFAVVEEMAMAETESNEREIEPCMEYGSGDMDDDASGWETVSRAEDQGSSYSLQGSTEWEERVSDGTPIMEITEVCSVQSKQEKKVKSITRLWQSCPSYSDNYKIISVDGNGMNGRLSNGRVSNSGMSPSDMVGWSSPDSGKLQINRGMKKGCIEWPRGAHNNSLKNRLLEARMESQKIQLRQVLKQKI